MEDSDLLFLTLNINTWRPEWQPAGKEGILVSASFGEDNFPFSDMIFFSLYGGRVIFDDISLCIWRMGKVFFKSVSLSMSFLIGIICELSYLYPYNALLFNRIMCVLVMKSVNFGYPCIWRGKIKSSLVSP